MGGGGVPDNAYHFRLREIRSTGRTTYVGNAEVTRRYGLVENLIWRPMNVLSGCVGALLSVNHVRENRNLYRVYEVSNISV